MPTTVHTDAADEVKADQAIIAEFLATRDKLISLRADLASEETALAGNEARYAEATRLHAAGEEADPAGVLADSDRRRHRIVGLKTLISEQEDAFRTLEAPNRAATLRELERRTAAHVVELNTAIAAAEAKATAEQTTLDRTLAEVRRLRLDLAEVIRGRDHQRNSLRPQRGAQ
jgi:hypothetical protein